MQEVHYFTISEAAVICDVKNDVVHGWIEKGLLIAKRIPLKDGQCILLSDLLDFMKSNQLDIPPELSQRTQRSVLIIEDDVPVANAIKRILRQVDADIHIANEGFEAGLKLSQLRPKVVTLDMQMPGIHGLIVLNLIKQDFPGTRIVVISAAEDSILDKAKDLGADFVFAKPFDNSELRDVIVSLL